MTADLVRLALSSGWIGFDSKQLANNDPDTHLKLINVNLPSNIYVKLDENSKVSSICVDIAMAGYDKDSISIDADSIGNKLSITSYNKQTDTTDSDYYFFRRGIKMSNLNMCIGFSSRYDITKLSVKFQDGILQIEVPILPEKEKPKSTFKVDIK